MAIPLEMLNFIVPIHLIEKTYPGGWKQCRRDHQDRLGYGAWHDEHLFRLGGMNGMDMLLLVEHWQGLGFNTHYGTTRPIKWRDICIVELFSGGPTLPCDWIAVDPGTATAWLKGTGRGGNDPC